MEAVVVEHHVSSAEADYLTSHLRFFPDLSLRLWGIVLPSFSLFLKPNTSELEPVALKYGVMISQYH